MLSDFITYKAANGLTVDLLADGGPILLAFTDKRGTDQYARLGTIGLNGADDVPSFHPENYGGDVGDSNIGWSVAYYEARSAS